MINPLSCSYQSQLWKIYRETQKSNLASKTKFMLIIMLNILYKQHIVVALHYFSTHLQTA